MILNIILTDRQTDSYVLNCNSCQACLFDFFGGVIFISLLRRRMLMQDIKKKVLYPLKNGVYESSGYTIEITNNNHVKAKGSIKESVNLTRLGENINFQPEWLSLEKHDICELILKNCIVSRDRAVHSNFRMANTNISSVFLIEINKGQNTKQIAMNTKQSIGCFFLYFQLNAEIEFDIEFWINGIRYF